MSNETKETTVAESVMLEVRKRFLERGYASIAAGLRAVKIDSATFYGALKEGLSGNPRYNTVKALETLGVLDLVPKPSGQ